MTAARRVTLFPGDGIGPEVVGAAQRVVAATGVALEWEVHEIGEAAARRSGGDPLPEAALASVRRNRVALKGPTSTPVGGGYRSANIGLRRALDLYAQVRPCQLYAGVQSRFAGVDVVVIRETTEDLYAGIEFGVGADETRALIDWIDAHGGASIARDAGISIKPISETATRRVFRFAFDYARAHGRTKVTAVHKARVMRATDGLFLEVAQEVAREYPEIQFDDEAIDALAARLVRRPETCDVLVLPNLYGDIVADLAAALVGGVGVVPGANYGDGVAVFEPTHGSAPKYAGRGVANPMATILSAALLLRHVGEEDAGARLEAAVAAVIARGERVTYDLKRSRDDPTAVGTSEVADAVVAALAA